MAKANVELRIIATNAIQVLERVNRVSRLADAATQRLKQAVTNMSSAVRQAGTQLQSFATRGLQQLKTSALNAAKALGGLRGALLSVGATAVVGGMIRSAASAEQLQLRLRSLSKEYGESARLQQFVAQSAKTFGQSQVEAAQGVADVYARLRPLGISLSQIETVYKGFNAVALASGTSAEAASGAFLQLSQALGSGTLQGDEFRSVAEQVPGILRLVANEMGVTVGELKKLGSDGKITADILINSLAKGFEESGSKVADLLAQSPAQRFKEFSNATQELSNALGSELLPALVPIVTAATELLKQFGALPGPVKTLIAAAVGLTAAFVALAPALVAVKGLLAGITLGGLIAAGPWIALAAGITAAAVALGSYRNEAQRLGAAARGGGVGDIAAARTRLSTIGQEISLAQRAQAGASGQRRQALSRQISRLRAQEAELRAGITAGEAAGVSAGVGGGRTAAAAAATGGGKASRSKQAKEIKDITAEELELRLRLGMAQQSQNKQQEAYYTKQLALLNISQQELGPNREKAEIMDAVVQYATTMRELEADQLKIDQQRIKDGAQLLIDKQNELALLQQTNPLKRDLLQIEQYLNSEEVKRLQLTDEQLNKLRELLTAMAQIKNKSDEMSQLYADIGMSIKDGVVGAIQGAIDGTKSLQQVATDLLNSIANRLLDVAVNLALFGAISGTGTGGGLLGKLIKPRAKGGSVSAGQPYLVGERGPELFMPGRSGGIAPTGSFGGGVNVVVNVDASGSNVQGNEPDARQLGRAISVAVQAELVKQQRPGGLLAGTR